MISFIQRATRRALPADVSVVVPLYNHERYIEEALGSVLAQSVSVREIVVVDDGSSDRSFDVVRRIAEREPRIRTWTRPNQGAHRTLNEGIAAARGTYVAILNSDDAFADRRIESCVALLERDPDAAMVGTRVAFIDGAGRLTRNAWYDEVYAGYRKSGDLAASLVFGNFLMTTSNVVVRKSVFTELGGFDDLRYAHDLDFFLRLASSRRRVSVIGAELLRYRYHPGNTIAESHAAVRAEVAACVAAYVHRVRAGAGDAAEALPRIAPVLASAERVGLGAAVAYLLAATVAGDPARPSSYLAPDVTSGLRKALTA